MRTQKKKIAVIFGTRPDTIKLAPIILELRKHPHFRVVNIATAQHRQMLDQVLDVFGIKPDFDLNIMEPKQSLAKLTKNTIAGLDDILVETKPDMVLVQGDTTTTFVGSLAAFYRQIPVGHVEAGLRTQDKANPFPEEINRRLTSCIADIHFAPTSTAKRALLKEHIPAGHIVVTGNSVIDALRYSIKKVYRFSDHRLNEYVQEKRRIILLTMHRRENWGTPMIGACEAVRTLANRYQDDRFVFPVHLNPIVRDVVYPILGDLKNVILIEPLPYGDFVNVMARSYLILTDSGGVQEEGPSLGKPVLVLRKVTERPEAVQFGTVKLVGLEQKKITSAAKTLLDNSEAYRRMASATNPYGDGHASRRTVQALEHFFGYSKKKPSEFRPR
ncbi:MAG: UDP-N-acetylglucosamine 2-epimerase (non-hydrolyzing) [Ignavibacteriales bacterium]|nr:UDP-N-acetylglucosamine 2-epimerase (non-hydrolyzing) [Ignavibacteriales bacterium]